MCRSDLLFSAVFLSGLFTLAACGGGDQKSDADGAVGESLTISSVSPDHGSQLGGMSIIISGDNLDDMTGMVMIGDNLASNVMVLEDGTISADVPATSAEGPVDVTVFSSSGYGILADAFSYNPLPTISDVQPRIGRSGDPVTITGKGFAEFNAGAASIKLGESDCNNVAVVNDTTATCVAGEAVASYQTQDVRLTNANGTGSFQGFAFRGPGLMVFGSKNSSNPLQVYFIDPLAESPTFIPVGQIDRPVHSPVLLANGNYVFRSTDELVPSLYSLDMDTLTSTHLSNIPGSQKITDMVANGNQLIALHKYSNDSTPFLSALNPIAGSETLINVSIITEIRRRMHGIAASGVDSFVVVDTGANPVLKITKTSASAATATVGFTDATPSNESIRDLTSVNGRIFGIRRGGGGLLPPPGGGGNSSATLIEIDPAANTITDIASLASDLHSLVEVK